MVVYVEETRKIAVIEAVDSFDSLDNEFIKIDRMMKDLEARKKVVSQKLITYFEKKYGHMGITEGNIQRVIQTIIVPDPFKLKRLLPQDVWDRIIEEKVNLDLFRAAVEMGYIPANIIQDAVETKPKDFIQVSKKGK